MEIDIVTANRIRNSFLFYAAIVSTISLWMIIQYYRKQNKFREGGIWVLIAIWMKTFTDMAELYSHEDQPLTWRAPFFYVIYIVLTVGLVKLATSTRPWRKEP